MIQFSMSAGDTGTERLRMMRLQEPYSEMAESLEREVVLLYHHVYVLARGKFGMGTV
jgi:hypothetical protein